MYGSIRTSPSGHEVPMEGDDDGSSSGKHFLVSAFAPPNVMYFEDVMSSTRGYGSHPTGRARGGPGKSRPIPRSGLKADHSFAFSVSP